MLIVFAEEPCTLCGTRPTEESPRRSVSFEANDPIEFILSLDRARLDSIQSNFNGLRWIGPNRTGPALTGLVRHGLDWTVLHWITT